MLGADSTTTILDGTGKPQAHLDHAQKLFEVGQPGSTIGLVTWGMGEIGDSSHRTLVALLGQKHRESSFPGLREMAEHLAGMMWDCYIRAFAKQHQRAVELGKKYVAGQCTPAETQELSDLASRLSGGYCLGGRIATVGPCQAYQITWLPWANAAEITELQPEVPYMWGVPSFMLRLMFGFDDNGVLRILQSGKWSGTPQELYNLVAQNVLMQPLHLPMREAIDWIHTIIHTTIRGIKFAQQPHVCGGPVEIAAITTDRPFRWVCHKPMDSAIITREGVYHEQAGR